MRSPLLVPALFESLLSTAYQASLTRDEGRQVIFRLLVAPPETLPEDGGVRFACWHDGAVTYWHYLSGHLLAV